MEIVWIVIFGLVLLRLINQIWGLPDFTIFGLHFSWHLPLFWRLGSWLSVYWAKEMFHNKKEFIPGLSLSFATLGVDISRERDWKI